MNNDQGDIIDHKDITLEGGLYGAQDVYDITGGVGDISAANGAIMVNQIGILDPGNHKLYLLVIQCEAQVLRAQPDHDRRGRPVLFGEGELT